MKGSGISALALVLSILAFIFALSGIIMPTTGIVAGDWQITALSNGEAFTIPSGKTYECYIYRGEYNGTNYTGLVVDQNDCYLCYGQCDGWFPAYTKISFSYDLTTVNHYYSCMLPQGWILTGGEELKPSVAFTKICVRWRDLTA